VLEWWERGKGREEERGEEGRSRGCKEASRPADARAGTYPGWRILRPADILASASRINTPKSCLHGLKIANRRAFSNFDPLDSNFFLTESRKYAYTFR
jgi:hypothetical protein